MLNWRTDWYEMRGSALCVAETINEEAFVKSSNRKSTKTDPEFVVLEYGSTM